MNFKFHFIQPESRPLSGKGGCTPPPNSQLDSWMLALLTGNCRNARGLGKSIVVFRLFEKLRYSNERSTTFESLCQEQQYFEEKNGKMVALQLTPKQRVCMDWVDKPKNYQDLYGILKVLRGSHLNNFPLKTLKLGWVAFHSVTFQLKCLGSQSNQHKKLVPVHSRFCNKLLLGLRFFLRG